MPKLQRDITDEIIEELGSVGLTIEEIASCLHASNSTILAHKEAYERGKNHLRQSLRRRQVEIALGADKKLALTMLIWLGKQYLGQADKNEMGGMDGKPIPVEVTDARSKLAAKLSERRTQPAAKGADEAPQ